MHVSTGQDTVHGTTPQIGQPMTIEKDDHLDPVLPVFKDWSAMSLFKKTSKTSEQLEGFLRTPTVLFHTGVWQYPLGDGRVQNFNARCWSRRWSYDGRSDRRTSLPFVTNDTAEPLEYSKNGKLMRSLYHIVNSFKHYISSSQTKPKGPSTSKP